MNSNDNNEKITYDKFSISHNCGCQSYIDNRGANETEFCAYHNKFIVDITAMWRGEGSE